jgi:hypothetical protein
MTPLRCWIGRKRIGFLLKIRIGLKKFLCAVGALNPNLCVTTGGDGNGQFWALVHLDHPKDQQKVCSNVYFNIGSDFITALLMYKAVSLF